MRFLHKQLLVDQRVFHRNFKVELNYWNTVQIKQVRLPKSKGFYKLVRNAL